MHNDAASFERSLCAASEAVSNAPENARRLMDKALKAQKGSSLGTVVEAMAMPRPATVVPAVRLGDTPGKWPMKPNRIMHWGEDGELWLMQSLVDWGYATCDNMRERGQMNKQLVNLLEEHFGVTADAQCIKNKLRDLEDTFKTCEKARKSISGLGWVDSQVAWDTQVWEGYKLAHPHKASELEGHKRIYMSEKYKLMAMLWGGKGKATGMTSNYLTPSLCLPPFLSLPPSLPLSASLHLSLPPSL